MSRCARGFNVRFMMGCHYCAVEFYVFYTSDTCGFGLMFPIQRLMIYVDSACLL